MSKVREPSCKGGGQPLCHEKHRHIREADSRDVAYLFHILPKRPGGGLCSFKLWRRATRVGSLGRLFSWSEAKRGPEPRRPDLVGDTGEVTEESEETELERSVLSMVAECTSIDTICCGKVLSFDGSQVAQRYSSEAEMVDRRSTTVEKGREGSGVFKPSRWQTTKLSSSGRGCSRTLAPRTTHHACVAAGTAELGDGVNKLSQRQP